MIRSPKQTNHPTSRYLQAILVGGLCPSQEDVAKCEADLPGFWNMIAALLWPGYWDPTVSKISLNNSQDDQCCQFMWICSIRVPGGMDVR